MIFYLIIVIAIVLAIRNAKARQQGYNQRSQSQQQYNQRSQPQQQYNQRPQPQYGQSYQRPQQNSQRSSGQTTNQQANGRYSRMANPKQNSERPVQPAQGNRPAAPGRNQARPDDILSRAAANVRENEADELMLHMETGTLVTDEPSELIREINDLIIMGYQADMSFERDFIAEGVELMNRYEISAEL